MFNIKLDGITDIQIARKVRQIAHLYMFPKIWGITESFAARRARIGSLPGVNSMVNFEAVLPSEAPATHFAEEFVFVLQISLIWKYRFYFFWILK